MHVLPHASQTSLVTNQVVAGCEKLPSAALFLFLVVHQANGAKITNSTNNGHAQTDGETVVCNQYIGTDVGTNDAIKKLDEKLDQIIKLLQTSPNQIKIITFKEYPPFRNR